MGGLEGAFRSFCVALVVIAAVVGWAAIEGLIWLFSNISIAWGG